MVFSDGVFFDPQDRLFKMWYMGGYGAARASPTSHDGISLGTAAFDVVPGTNIVTPPTAIRARSGSISTTTDRPTALQDVAVARPRAGAVRVAGRHSLDANRRAPGAAGDRSTFFYNPFRKRVGVQPPRRPVRGAGQRTLPPLLGIAGLRALRGTWTGTEPVAWVKADSHDLRATGHAQSPPELYNLDCVAYESVMLGLFSIWRGESAVREKINEVTLGFSRDGFHWHRPDRAVVPRRSRKRPAAGTGRTCNRPAAAAWSSAIGSTST